MQQRIIVAKTDDLYKLVASMSDANAEEVVFVIPPDIDFMHNPISFKFLERQADMLGKKASFVNEKNETLPPAEEKNYGNVAIEKEKTPNIPNIPISFQGILKNAVFLVFGFALLSGLLAGAWWVFPNAKAVVTVNSEMLVKNVDITANVGVSSINESDRQIPAVLLETSKKASDSIKTTGEKEVGEKATGVVKIYNKTDSKKTFGKGTKLSLISADTEDINYYILDEVTVDGRSELPEGITYGSSEVDVEAEKFGTEYNIEKDQKFKVDDHDTSEFLAQNEKDFTGGSSKKVSAVSKKDKDTLEHSLEVALKKEVKKDLESKLVGKQKIAENSISFDLVSEVFDKNVGDEADILVLSSQIKAYALAYYQDDLEKVVKSVLERSIPDHYSLSNSETRFEIGKVLADTPTPPSKDKLDLLVKVRSFVVPKISEEDIRNNIANKSVEDAHKYLKGLKNVSSYELVVWPRLPGFLDTTPHIKSRIRVEIKSK